MLIVRERRTLLERDERIVAPCVDDFHAKTLLQ
jgi:hypothetical protein